MINAWICNDATLNMTVFEFFNHYSQQGKDMLSDLDLTEGVRRQRHLESPNRTWKSHGPAKYSTRLARCSINQVVLLSG